MPRVAFRSAQAATDHDERQDLVVFADTPTPTAEDPVATGVTQCDTEGYPLMGRLVSGSVVDTATTTPVTAFAQNLLRDEAVIQNVDEAEGVLLVYLAGHDGAKFRVQPDGTFVWRGGDEIFVRAATGTCAWVGVER
jgi:hypothetical protein